MRPFSSRIAYLTCETPRGPCRDLGDNPILWSHERSPLIGPGHQAMWARVQVVPTQEFMAKARGGQRVSCAAR